MTTDHYAGDSWAKRQVRFLAWKSAFDITDVRVQGLYVYLSGRDAADFRLLRGNGRQRRALGFEINKEAHARAEALGARVLNCDIADLDRAAMAPTAIAVASLDYCSTVNNATLRTAARVASLVATGGVVMFWGLKGRDATDITWPTTLVNRRTRRALSAQGVDPNRVNMSELRKQYQDYYTGSKEAGADTVVANGVDRANLVANWLSAATLRGWHAKDVFTYKATSPMFCVVLAEIPGKMRVNCLNENDDDGHKDTVRELCVNMDMSADRTSDIFNVDVGTVSAWRAHATRGTYT